MASHGCHSYAVCKRCGDWRFHSKLSSPYCQCGARFSSHHIKLASAACPLFKWGISRPRQSYSYGRNERSNGTAAPEPEAAADEHSLLVSAQEEFVAFKKKYSDVLVGDGATCVFKEVKPSPVAACHTAKNKYNRALSVSTKSSHRVIAIQAEIQQLQEQLDEKKKTLVEAQQQAEKAQADLDEAHSAHCAAEAARKAEADAASAARRSGDDQMDTDDPPNVKNEVSTVQRIFSSRFMTLSRGKSARTTTRIRHSSGAKTQQKFKLLSWRLLKVSSRMLKPAQPYQPTASPRSRRRNFSSRRRGRRRRGGVKISKPAHFFYANITNWSDKASTFLKTVTAHVFIAVETHVDSSTSTSVGLDLLRNNGRPFVAPAMRSDSGGTMGGIIIAPHKYLAVAPLPDWSVDHNGTYFAEDAFPYAAACQITLKGIDILIMAGYHRGGQLDTVWNRWCLWTKRAQLPFIIFADFNDSEANLQAGPWLDCLEAVIVPFEGPTCKNSHGDSRIDFVIISKSLTGMFEHLCDD